MFRIRQYPDQFPIRSAQVSTGNNVTLETRVEHLGVSEYTQKTLDKLQIHHQVGENFTGQGYLEDGSIHDIVAVSTTEVFPCFIEDRDYAYTTGTKRVISEQALTRLKRFPDDNGRKFETRSVKINLVAFKEALDNEDAIIKGGWFRGMQIDNVEVAYLGGGSVVDSTDWERFENSGGSISALRVVLPTIDVEAEATKVLITSDGNCVVYKNNLGEIDLLDISVPLFDLAKQHLVEH